MSQAFLLQKLFLGKDSLGGAVAQLPGQLLQPHVTARGWWGPGTTEECPSQPETFSDGRLCRKCQNQLWKPGCVGVCFIFNCGKQTNKQKCNIKLTILTFFKWHHIHPFSFGSIIITLDCQSILKEISPGKKIYCTF